MMNSLHFNSDPFGVNDLLQHLWISISIPTCQMSINVIHRLANPSEKKSMTCSQLNSSCVISHLVESFVTNLGIISMSC